jgi:uncharacterized membrane protein YagU involved in acid resistance
MSHGTAERISTTAKTSWRTILLAGVAAAAVDAAYFTAKSLLENVGPFQVLKGIAGFWLGPAASTGGLSSAALGAATHLGLAIIMAAGFVIICRFVPKLRGSLIKMGAAYGLLLYAIMYGIVLPLRWPQVFPSFNGWTSIFDVIVHVVVGVAIAAVALSAQQTGYEKI